MTNHPQGRDLIQTELQSSDISQARLAEIAAAHPEFHQQIATHPAAYPDLIAWIDAQSQSQSTPQPQPTPTLAQVPTDAHPPAQGTVEQPDPVQPASVEEPAPAQRPRQSVTGAVLTGIGIGAVLGGALTAALILWVLPGLFGSIIG